MEGKFALVFLIAFVYFIFFDRVKILGLRWQGEANFRFFRLFCLQVKIIFQMLFLIVCHFFLSLQKLQKKIGIFPPKFTYHLILFLGFILGLVRLIF